MVAQDLVADDGLSVLCDLILDFLQTYVDGDMNVRSGPDHGSYLLKDDMGVGGKKCKEEKMPHFDFYFFPAGTGVTHCREATGHPLPWLVVGTGRRGCFRSRPRFPLAASQRPLSSKFQSLLSLLSLLSLAAAAGASFGCRAGNGRSSGLSLLPGSGFAGSGSSGMMALPDFGLGRREVEDRPGPWHRLPGEWCLVPGEWGRVQGLPEVVVEVRTEV